MKNQNDLIISISVGVVALIVAAVIFFTAPQASKPADPAVVDVSKPKYPAAGISYTNGLSGGSSAAGGRMGGFGGMMGGMGGPGGGMMMPGGPMGGPGGGGKRSLRLGAAGGGG